MRRCTKLDVLVPTWGCAFVIVFGLLECFVLEVQIQLGLEHSEHYFVCPPVFGFQSVYLGHFFAFPPSRSGTSMFGSGGGSKWGEFWVGPKAEVEKIHCSLRSPMIRTPYPIPQTSKLQSQ